MPVKNIKAAEMIEMMEQGEADIVDIRSLEEYKIVRLKNSKFIPMVEFADRLGEIDWEKKVVLVCRSGSRSLHVANELSKSGKEVYNLENGLEELYSSGKAGLLEMDKQAIDAYF